MNLTSEKNLIIIIRKKHKYLSYNLIDAAQRSLKMTTVSMKRL